MGSVSSMAPPWEPSRAGDAWLFVPHTRTLLSPSRYTHRHTRPPLVLPSVVVPRSYGCPHRVLGEVPRRQLRVQACHPTEGSGEGFAQVEGADGAGVERSWGAAEPRLDALRNPQAGTSHPAVQAASRDRPGVWKSRPCPGARGQEGLPTGPS